MLCFFAAKGGVGCSVVAAASAVLAARQCPTLLVDLHGDLPAILGVETPGAGLCEWFQSESPPADALHRLEVPLNDRLSLLPVGVGLRRRELVGEGIDSPAMRLLARLLATEGRVVVVDVGVAGHGAHALLESAQRTALVTRACYLALRRAQSLPTPDELVLVEEPGRSLRPGDVAAAVGVPLGATVAWDPAISRVVDAGLMLTRVPRGLRKLRALTEADGVTQ